MDGANSIDATNDPTSFAKPSLVEGHGFSTDKKRKDGSPGFGDGSLSDQHDGKHKCNNRHSDQPNGKNRRNRFPTDRIQFGSRNKKRNMGRSEYFSADIDKRKRTEEAQAKRLKKDGDTTRASLLPAPFSKEEIESEDRRPKRKVAVLIGYSGSGYKGMQISPTEKTMEGDLFAAFVAAGAISKVNADDPKKSHLVRCARTDKGVHAAGNVISLKLIVESEDIVEKINGQLCPSIRVWGIQRTTGSFSCYQACDSRWYEYLIPVHAFLPPHPKSFLAKELDKLADQAQDREGYEERQKEVASFWDDVETNTIKPLLEEMDPSIQDIIRKALYMTDEEVESDEEDQDGNPANILDTNADFAPPGPDINPLDATDTVAQPSVDSCAKPSHAKHARKVTDPEVEQAVKALRAEYIKAKRSYRINPVRLQRVKSVFSLYEGTRNFHNYTPQKSYRDPSAKRVIRSFTVSNDPIVIEGTEWLSLKVHGQSFMMHQIRKMVSMASLIVRCGCDPERILDSFGPASLSIPKAPGHGLLLERPVFDVYSKSAAKYGREKIDFGKYEDAIEDFKQREIYKRIFNEEAQENLFHSFFTHLDNCKASHFLFVSSVGIAACNSGGPNNHESRGVNRTQRTLELKDFDGDDEVDQ